MPDFTHDMLRDFRNNAPVVFKELVGKPVQFLEVGTFEGQAACWLMDRVLTNCNSLYIGVEVDQVRYEKTRKNLEGYSKDKWGVILGDSARILPSLQPWFHGIYVDGDHRYEQARVDVFNGWRLLIKGGVMLIDDYLLECSPTDQSIKYGVKQAVDEMVRSLKYYQYEIMSPRESYQFAIRKVEEQ